MDVARLSRNSRNTCLGRSRFACPGIPHIAPSKTVGVIGAGTMGGGISMNFVNAGMDVVIVETKQEALDRGLGSRSRKL